MWTMGRIPAASACTTWARSPPVHRHIEVIAHILSFEGGYLEPPSLEYATERGCYDRFAHITSGSQNHQGLCHIKPLPEKIGSQILVFHLES